MFGESSSTSGVEHDTINSCFIHEIHCGILQPEIINAIKSDLTFKVLKIIECRNLRELITRLEQISFIFKQTSHFFMIHIELVGGFKVLNDDEERVLESLVGPERPLIVQLISLTKTKNIIYFKEENERTFNKVDCSRAITREEFINETTLKTSCNLHLMLRALKSGLFGEFSGDLLEVTLKRDVDRFTFTNTFAANNSFCLRFLKLHHESFMGSFWYSWSEELLSSLSLNGINSLAVLLDLPFDLVKDEVTLREKLLANDESYVMLLAIQMKNFDAVKFLATNGEFGSSETADGGEGANRKAFDTNIAAALTTALESKQFKIYSYLRSEGFSSKGDRNFIRIFNRLNDAEKAEIRECNKEFFRHFDAPHLIELLSKTSLNDKSKCGQFDSFRIIRTIYDELNDVAEIESILKTISTSDHLNIVFDFDALSIDVLDPTKCKKLNEKGESINDRGEIYYVRGASYHELGYIYVAAGNYQQKFHDILGTLAHEMTHFAMFLLYENRCLPYLVHDQSRMIEYESVVEKTKNYIEQSPESVSNTIVSDAFNNYGEAIWPMEVIVRVPQLLAKYKRDTHKLLDLRKGFSELFSFYADKTFKDFKPFIEKKSNERLIEQINMSDSLFRLVNYTNKHFKKADLKPYTKDMFNVVVSNASVISVTTIFKSILEKGIFLNIESIVNNKELERKVVDSFNSAVKPRLILDCATRLRQYEKDLYSFLVHFEEISRVTIVVATNKEAFFLKRDLKNINIQYMNHLWAEVQEAHRQEFLEHEVNFQGFSVYLNELVETTSDSLNHFPLNDLVTRKETKVSEELKKKETSVPRKFLMKTRQDQDSLIYTNDEKSFDELLAYGASRKVVILADVAGTGKSSVLNEIAHATKQKHLNSWVSFIDLKKHVNEFSRKAQNETSFENFFISTVFPMQTDFDHELFLEHYRNGRTIILLDGFDEISPEYKELMLKQIASFDVDSGNQLWVTTRSHLEENLAAALNQSTTFSFIPLSEQEQTEYLFNALKKSAHAANIDQSTKLAKNLVDELTKLSGSIGTIIGTPLLLSLVATIYEKSTSVADFTSIKLESFYSIYDKFVRKFFSVWNDKSEYTRHVVNDVFMEETSPITVHQILAIKHCFQENVISRLNLDMEYDEDVWGKEKLSQIGIFRYEMKSQLSNSCQ